jgi:hypothetical protein
MTFAKSIQRAEEIFHKLGLQIFPASWKRLEESIKSKLNSKNFCFLTPRLMCSYVPEMFLLILKYLFIHFFVGVLLIFILRKWIHVCPWIRFSSLIFLVRDFFSVAFQPNNLQFCLTANLATFSDDFVIPYPTSTNKRLLWQFLIVLPKLWSYWFLLQMQPHQPFPRKKKLR